MINSSLRNYGLLTLFIGIVATAAAVLGGVLVAGLISAAGEVRLAHLLLLRDGVCLLGLGLTASLNGGRISRYLRSALVRWEWCCWIVAYLALFLTLAAVILIDVGTEYFLPPVFYIVNAAVATRTRRKNEGYFVYLLGEQAAEQERSRTPE